MCSVSAVKSHLFPNVNTGIKPLNSPRFSTYSMILLNLIYFKIKKLNESCFSAGCFPSFPSPPVFTVLVALTSSHICVCMCGYICSGWGWLCLNICRNEVQLNIG